MPGTGPSRRRYGPRTGVLALALLASNAPAGPGAFESWIQVGAVQAPAITETSGVVASRRSPGVLWVHNDSGDSARIFALDEAGTLLGTYSITGASAVDWEDIAIGTDPGDGLEYLFIGDIGDNTAARNTIRVYKVPEPGVDTNATAVVSNLAVSAAYTLQYVDGARDAETLLVDPLNADLYIVTKRENPCRIYHAAYPLSATATNLLQFDGLTTRTGFTGGDISPSGLEVLVKTYFFVFYWCRAASEPLSSLLTSAPIFAPYRLEPQGEAITWKADGNGYYTISEGSAQPIYFWAASDTDGDGLTDSEEFALGTDPDVPDTDMDGQTDGEEAIAGVDPNDSNSFFAVAAILSASPGIDLQWEALTDRVYGIDRTLDLVTFEKIRSNLIFATEGTVITNLSPQTDQDAYRLRVRKAP